jgi:hypothetical protein
MLAYNLIHNKKSLNKGIAMAVLFILLATSFRYEAIVPGILIIFETFTTKFYQSKLSKLSISFLITCFITVSLTMLTRLHEKIFYYLFRNGFGDPLLPLSNMQTVFSAPLIVLALGGMTLSVFHLSPKSKEVKISGLIIGITLSLLVLISYKAGIFSPRYLLIILPFLIVCSCYFVATTLVWLNRVRILLAPFKQSLRIGGILSIMLIVLLAFQSYSNVVNARDYILKSQQDFVKSAMQVGLFLRQNANSNDIILNDNPAVAFYSNLTPYNLISARQVPKGISILKEIREKRFDYFIFDGTSDKYNTWFSFLASGRRAYGLVPIFSEGRFIVYKVVDFSPMLILHTKGNIYTEDLRPLGSIIDISYKSELLAYEETSDSILLQFGIRNDCSTNITILEFLLPQDYNIAADIQPLIWSRKNDTNWLMTGSQVYGVITLNGKIAPLALYRPGKHGDEAYLWNYYGWIPDVQFRYSQYGSEQIRIGFAIKLPCDDILFMRLRIYIKRS